MVRFADEGTQLKAQDVVKEALGRTHTVALNLAPATPGWLRTLGAEPMFLGLDLRGGVHFLMQVDMEAAIVKAEERYVSDIRTQLRDERIRYRTITRRRDGGLLIRFRDAEQRRLGIIEIEDSFTDLELEQPGSESDEFPLLARLSDNAVKETRRLALAAEHHHLTQTGERTGRGRTDYSAAGAGARGRAIAGGAGHCPGKRDPGRYRNPGIPHDRRGAFRAGCAGWARACRFPAVL